MDDGRQAADGTFTSVWQVVITLTIPLLAMAVIGAGLHNALGRIRDNAVQVSKASVVRPQASGNAGKSGAGASQATPVPVIDAQKTPVGGGTSSQPAQSSGQASPDNKIQSSGQVAYGQYCAGCHGSKDSSGMSGFSSSYIVDAVANGTGGMPAFGAQLTQDNIKAIAVYITNR